MFAAGESTPATTSLLFVLARLTPTLNDEISTDKPITFGFSEK
jgi:hypothetical protein